MANDRKCICCGKTFSYCPHCKDRSNGYSTIFDTKECAVLANAISGYGMGRVTKEQIKAVLDEYNIIDYSKYTQSVRDKLSELFPKYERGIRAELNFYDEASYVPEVKEETKEVIQETTVTQDEQKENDTPTENVTSDDKPRRKRKSRRKKVDLPNETVDHSESN